MSIPARLVCVRPLAVILAVASISSLMLSACGSSTAPAAPPRSGHQGAVPAPHVDPGAGLVDAVDAVDAAQSTGPISLKFQIGARPTVGVPVRVTLALQPAPDSRLEHIFVSFSGAGLDIQSDRSFDVTEPRGGVALQRVVTVTPQVAGVLDLKAVIVIDTGTGSSTRVYTIPLIAASAAT